MTRVRSPSAFVTGRVALGAVVLALLGVALCACASPRLVLGTTTSPCFEALPVGAAAVGGRPHLAGVRMLSVGAVERAARLSGGPGTLRVRATTQACVITYRGVFHIDEVEQPVGSSPPGGTGTFAVVIVARPANKLLGTLVTEHPLHS